VPRMNRARALLVAGLGMVLLIAATASVAARTSASPDLPPITADRLVTSTLRALANDGPVSGRMAVHLDLGLPSIPDTGPGAVGAGTGGFLASLSGNHRLRLWSSADGFRLADLLKASERAIFVSRTDAWAWDFDSFTAYHLGRFPDGTGRKERRGSGEMLDLVDPLVLTRRALEAITPSTRVLVRGTASVAGRDAYLLVVEPRTSETLVARIEIAIDAERRAPLRVEVFSRLRRAAPVSVGFTSISFAHIDPSVYRFSPPPGSTVRDIAGEMGKEHEVAGPQAGGSMESGEYAEAPARVFGHDWTTVIALRTPPLAALRRAVGAGGLDPTSLLPLSGPLLSVRLVERGDHAWLVYGLVPQSSLIAVSGELT
jgi:hypothetical protein